MSSDEGEESFVEEKKVKVSTGFQPTNLTIEDYQGIMSKANKQPNKFKKRLDVSRAKKLKAKVSFVN